MSLSAAADEIGVALGDAFAEREIASAASAPPQEQPGRCLTGHWLSRDQSGSRDRW
jgi:hypothetical protein